jgi:glycosyltransferase involved in cell wall biosynthesis
VTLLTSDISCDSNELYELKNRLIKIPSRNLAVASKMKHFARDALDSSRVFRKEGTSFRSQFTILAKRFLKSIFADPYNTVSDSLAKDRLLRIDGRSYLETIHGYIDNKGIVILLTSAGPAIMHRIGYEIKKRFPQVFWIADYRDQIVGNPVAKATPRMRKANYLAIKNADMIAAVSEGLVNDIAKYSPVGKEAVLAKSYTLYNGFTSKSAVNPYKPTVDNQRIRIAYTGVLYSMRRIDYLIRAIKEVNSSITKSFELLYCGASSSIVERMVAEEAANSFVTNKGFVSKQEAEKEQDEADILLLLKSNEPETGGMTGKFFEYLERDKPILVLGDSDSEFNEIARKIGGIYVLPYDEEKIKEFLIDFASRWPFEIERNAEEVDKFNWNNLAKGLIEEVERRLKKR